MDDDGIRTLQEMRGCRYPGNPDGNEYPVPDPVKCYGSFPDADNPCEYGSRSFRDSGSHGDIPLRDRKMYGAPTPFALAEGTAHHRTPVMPADTVVIFSSPPAFTLQR